MLLDEPKALPALTRGLDVLAQETALPPGSGRVVHNVVLQDDGGFGRRPGHTSLFTLAGAHSVWKSPSTGNVYVAAGPSLYQVNIAAASAALIFTGLQPETPVEYDEVADTTYFCAPNVLGKITAASQVRRPGIANLVGYRPTLTAAAGGLLPGTYAVAYSLLNDLGEESGLSSLAFLELASGGGITLTNLQTASNVTRMNVYVSAPNGGEMYLHVNLAVAGSASITDQMVSRQAVNADLDPLPGGDIVRYFRGRLYVARGSWLYYSAPFNYGLMNIKSGWVTLGRDIKVLEPVESGLFLGFSDRTEFLRGTGPGDFQVVPVSARGAIAHSGVRVPADYFSAGHVKDRASPVACWLSDYGVVIGHADGTVSYPQADQLRMSVTSPARALFMQRNGVKQAVFCVESIDLGVSAAVDSTI